MDAPHWTTKDTETNYHLDNEIDKLVVKYGLRIIFPEVKPLIVHETNQKTPNHIWIKNFSKQQRYKKLCRLNHVLPGVSLFPFRHLSPTKTSPKIGLYQKTCNHLAVRPNFSTATTATAAKQKMTSRKRLVWWWWKNLAKIIHW